MSRKGRRWQQKRGRRGGQGGKERSVILVVIALAVMREGRTYVALNMAKCTMRDARRTALLLARKHREPISAHNSLARFFSGEIPPPMEAGIAPAARADTGPTPTMNGSPATRRGSLTNSRVTAP